MVDNDDENELPPLRPRDLPLHPRSLASLGKRSRGYSYSNSSDAPYFSSDDLADACVDDYATPRRKKQNRRHWWDSDLVTPAKEDLSSRMSTKPKDSGVFMSSDSSSNDDGFGVGQLSAQNLKRHGKKFPVETNAHPRTVEKLDLDAESIPRRIVQRCLEADQEDVDLSRCGLVSLSNETLKPLRNLIRQPKFHQDHRVDKAFRSFKPELKLFLSSNLLRRVPGEVLNLEHLTVLSLRNNKLTELPHSLGRLHNLQELNVAGNRLTWLPWELLSLCGGAGKMQNLYLCPNPFFAALPAEPSFTVAGSFGFPENYQGLLASIESLATKMESLDASPDNDVLKEKISWVLLLQQTHLKRLTVGGPLDVCKRAPIYLGSTGITFFDLDGTVPRSSQPAPSQVLRGTHILPMAPRSPPSVSLRNSRTASNSRVQSLFELALSTCSDNLLFADIDKHLPDETPELIVRMLEAARNASEDGGTLCSVCQRKYIVPRAEWVEYWHCWPDRGQVSVDELFFPFLRRSCSWKCADEALQNREDQASGV